MFSEEVRKSKEEHPRVCGSFRIHLSQYCCTEKSPIYSKGRVVTKKEIQVGKRERVGGRQKRSEGAGVRNPPLHLLVIYSFMLARRLAQGLIFWRRRYSSYKPSAVPGCKQDRGEQKKTTTTTKKGKDEAFLIDWFFTPCFSSLSRWPLVISSLSKAKEEKHQPNQSLILFVLKNWISPLIDCSSTWITFSSEF